MTTYDHRERSRRREQRLRGAAPGAGGGGGKVDPRFAEYRATGDRRIRNELVEEHRWLALHCARQFARKGEPLDDLVQVATVGVLKAVDRFDPTFGVVFSTFAVPTITGELRRHFRDKTWSVHVPRRAKELYQSVSGVAEELSQTLMRSPTVPEIAHRSGTTVEEALEALEVRASYRGVPLATPGDDERPDAPGVGTEDAGYNAAEARLTVGRLLSTLGERDRTIVELRFLYGLTQSEIACRVGVSQVHVSRLLRAALQRMRRPLLRDRA
ncbi:MAG TPA: SigB/SigF/SigG family RNA polymerase sigma factor [Acidimicrobiales bacterium]|nr:SigB/SigF/SigG family RNA polymerase sigma factor [Acidimicrobiales bacterium]